MQHRSEDAIADLLKHRDMGKRKTIVIVAEGAHDLALKKVTPARVKDLLSNDLKLDTRITTLGHVQRGGRPCAYDRMLSTLQGVEAVHAVLQAKPDTPSPVICVIENKIVRKPLLKAVEDTLEVAKAIEAKDFARAMHLRDAEFAEYHNAYTVTTATGTKPEQRLPKDKVSVSYSVNSRCLTFPANADWHNPCWCSRRRDERINQSSSGVLSNPRPYSGCAPQRIPRSMSSPRRSTSGLGARNVMVRCAGMGQQGRVGDWLQPSATIGRHAQDGMVL